MIAKNPITSIIGGLILLCTGIGFFVPGLEVICAKVDMFLSGIGFVVSMDGK